MVLHTVTNRLLCHPSDCQMCCHWWRLSSAWRNGDSWADHLATTGTRTTLVKRYIVVLLTCRVAVVWLLRQHHPKIIDSAVFGRTAFSIVVSLWRCAVLTLVLTNGAVLPVAGLGGAGASKAVVLLALTLNLCCHPTTCSRALMSHCLCCSWLSSCSCDGLAAFYGHWWHLRQV